MTAMPPRKSNSNDSPSGTEKKRKNNKESVEETMREILKEVRAVQISQEYISDSHDDLLSEMKKMKHDRMAGGVVIRGIDLPDQLAAPVNRSQFILMRLLHSVHVATMASSLFVKKLNRLCT